MIITTTTTITDYVKWKIDKTSIRARVSYVMLKISKLITGCKLPPPNTLCKNR